MEIFLWKNYLRYKRNSRIKLLKSKKKRTLPQPPFRIIIKDDHFLAMYQHRKKLQFYSKSQQFKINQFLMPQNKSKKQLLLIHFGQQVTQIRNLKQIRLQLLMIFSVLQQLNSNQKLNLPIKIKCMTSFSQQNQVNQVSQ